MLAHRYFYWWKEFLLETSSFRIIPSKCLILISNQMMHQLPFFRPKKVLIMKLIHLLHSFFGISPARLKSGRIRVQLRHILQRIPLDIPNNPKFLRKRTQNGFNFLINRLILLTRIGRDNRRFLQPFCFPDSIPYYPISVYSIIILRSLYL